MSNHFLFELGTEEIPASMIIPALDQLKSNFEQMLRDKDVAFHEVRTFSTPRRLSLYGEGLPDRQPDRQETLTGPSRKVAFQESGQPTAAARGFASKFGLSVEDLQTISTEKGEYLATVQSIKGRDVPEILEDVLPGLVASLSWPKNMYWTESRFRFIRPLRWFVALWNDQVLYFEMEGVGSGRVSRGHRSLGSSRIELKNPQEYRSVLRDNFVLVDREERRQRIQEGIQAVLQPRETLRSDPQLLETVLDLNEFPNVIRGQFESRFIEIPQEVLVTVMRFHQKYFSVLNEEGKLEPAFLTVINTEEDSEGQIQSGHERVLEARLEDARFFWETDRKVLLEERKPLLEDIIFQEDLGSYAAKARRIRTICESLGGSGEIVQAADLCKVDLTTDMVREFPELQGIMGGLYARAEKKPPAVWRSIYEHYLPISFEDPVPDSEGGAMLSVADRIDTITGCFSAGIAPTGSRDPFGLRRQAQGLIRILYVRGLDWALEELIEQALSHFDVKDGGDTKSRVYEFLLRRVRFLLEQEGFEYDVINAVIATGVKTVPDAAARCSALAAIREDEDFGAVAIAYKRIKNILADQSVRASPDTKLFEYDEEEDLYAFHRRLNAEIAKHIEKRNYQGALRQMAALRPQVDAFFDTVLVMADDQDVRQNRLALLKSVSEMFLLVADISEIVQRGERNGR